MLKLAAIQMVSSDDVATNLNNAAHLIKQAVTQHAKLIVLPENFALFSADETTKVALKEPLGKGPIQHFLAQQAAQHGVTLIAGTIPIESPFANKVYATTLVFNEVGQRIAHYHKIHLFDVMVEDESYRESHTTSPGKEVVVVDLPSARVGLSICYDVRFPELYRQLHAQQVDIIALPAAFTEITGKAHWDVLTRARAIENQCYVVAANQGGLHPAGRTTYGHSMIVNPWGEVVASLEKGEGVVVTVFDRDTLHTLRNRFPVGQHRRL